MKKVGLALFAVTLVALTGAPPASAQSDATLVTVPFDFIVNGHVLPAGHYRMGAAAEDPAVLLVENTRNPKVEALATVGVASEPAQGADNDRVEFKRVDGQMFLWQVPVPGLETREIDVTRASAEHTLARLGLLPAKGGRG